MRRAFCSILAAATIAAAFIAGPARAQCTGWPVVCAGVPPPTGAGGGMGGAMGAVGIGIGLLGILQQMDQQQAPPPPAMAPAPGPVPGTGSYGAAPAGPSPSVEAQKAAILMQMRPLSIGGSYSASDPASPASTSADAPGSAVLNPIAPLAASPANSDGGAGLGGGGDPAQAWKASVLRQMRPLDGSDEAASANARAPFDTAAPGNPAHSAADQLCQAAGAGNGCIGTLGAGSAAPAATAGTGAVAVAGAGAALLIPPSPGLVCGARLDISAPILLGGMASPSGRAAGFPVATSLDQLRSFDYSDIKANLAAMSPEELARMKLAAAQEAARLEATIDAIRVKLFAAGIGAASPVGPLLAVAQDALLETAKDEVPFWRQVEALAQKRPGAGEPMSPDEQHAALGEVFDQVDKSADWLKKYAALIDRIGLDGKALPPEPPGTPTLAFGLSRSLLEAILAKEAAAKGDKMRATGHIGNAFQALSPLAELLLPEKWAPFLSKAEGMQQAALIAIELAVHYGEGAKARSQALDAQAANKALALALGTRLAALNGKLRDIRNLQQLIAQEPRCA